MIYADNAATAQLRPAACAAMAAWLGPDGFGNASSIYKLARDAKKALEEARKTVASALGAKPNEIYFTSGGTESNCIAILGAAKRAGVSAVTSKAEHPSVLNSFKELSNRGVDVKYLQPDKSGLISLEGLNDRTVLVSLSHVNHETGVITDIEGISRAIKSYNKDILLHIDAVQGFGKHPIDVRKWNADLISVSAHKMHGMSGTGALYVRAGVLGKLKPIIYGGGHERGLRPGTENLAGISAFGAAAEVCTKDMEKNIIHVTKIKNRLSEIPQEIEGAVINGEGNLSPYIINISFMGVNSEVLQSALDARKIYVSAGAACNTGNKTPDNVVFSYGLGAARAESAIRISLSKYNTPDDAEILITALKELVPSLRRIV